jgi:hypothetical protein
MPPRHLKSATESSLGLPPWDEEERTLLEKACRPRENLFLTEQHDRSLRRTFIARAKRPDTQGPTYGDRRELNSDPGFIGGNSVGPRRKIRLLILRRGDE